MARALSQILQELNNVYDPQRDIYNQRLTALPDEMVAEEKGLEAAKQDAFSDITNQANRRGLLYSGIPVAEQQRYTGATFLPAVANLRNNFNTRRFNLQDTLAQLTQKQYESAYGIHQGELDAEARAAEARAAGAGGASPSFGFDGLGGGGQVLGSATMTQRANKGFNFVDANGRPINAAQYAAARGISFRALLQTMANAGDAGARAALGFIGDNLKYDPRKVKTQAQLNLYKALTGRGGDAGYALANQPGLNIQYAPSSSGLVGAPAGVRF